MLMTGRYLRYHTRRHRITEECHSMTWVCEEMETSRSRRLPWAARRENRRIYEIGSSVNRKSGSAAFLLRLRYLD